MEGASSGPKWLKMPVRPRNGRRWESASRHFCPQLASAGGFSKSRSAQRPFNVSKKSLGLAGGEGLAPDEALGGFQGGGQRYESQVVQLVGLEQAAIGERAADALPHEELGVQWQVVGGAHVHLVGQVSQPLAEHAHLHALARADERLVQQVLGHDGRLCCQGVVAADKETPRVGVG